MSRMGTMEGKKTPVAIRLDLVKKQLVLVKPVLPRQRRLSSSRRLPPS